MFGLGFIAAGISTLVGVVSGVCSTVGGAMISTGNVMIDAIGIGLQAVKNICDVALTVGEAFGLFSPEQNENDMLELGMRVEQAAAEDITSDQFDSNQAYIDHIREHVTLSKDNIENLDHLADKDKLKYACIGSAMTLAVIKEKYEVDIPDTLWSTATDLGVTADQFKAMLDVFEGANVEPDLEGFLKGKLTTESQKCMYNLIDDQLDKVLSNETLDKLLG